VFDALSRLVDQSLVVASEHEGATRYRLLETVREYALDHLEQNGEGAAVRRRHLRWCVRLAEEWDAVFRGPGQGAGLARLAAQLDDLRAALDWAAAPPAGDRAGRPAVVGDGLRLAAALHWFWIGVGVVQEAHERTGALLALDDSGPAGPRAGALAAAGHLATILGEIADAEARLKESVVLWRRAGDERGLALALAFLGMALRYRPALDEAEAGLAEARALAARLDDRLCRYWAAHGLATIRRARGDGPGAVTLDEEGLAIAETDGPPGHVPLSKILLANSLQVAGDLPRARRLLAESLEGEEFGGQLAVAPRLVGFATLAAREGHPERALRLAGAAAALRARTGEAVSAAQVRFDPALAAAAEALGDAAGAAFAAGRAMSLEAALAYALAEVPPA
jgi:non-specific serine/threonine protein kinase